MTTQAVDEGRASVVISEMSGCASALCLSSPSSIYVPGPAGDPTSSGPFRFRHYPQPACRWIQPDERGLIRFKRATGRLRMVEVR